MIRGHQANSRERQGKCGFTALILTIAITGDSELSPLAPGFC